MLIPPTSQTPADVLGHPALASCTPANPFYVIFFASPNESGMSWCPDCTRSQASINSLIPESSSSLVYVGDRNSWRNPSNPFRLAPFGITNLPTIIKFTSPPSASLDTPIPRSAKLIEEEVLKLEKLKAFVA